MLPLIHAWVREGGGDRLPMTSGEMLLFLCLTVACRLWVL